MTNLKSTYLLTKLNSELKNKAIIACRMSGTSLSQELNKNATKTMEKIVKDYEDKK